jgi:hypothetical protein
VPVFHTSELSSTMRNRTDEPCCSPANKFAGHGVTSLPFLAVTPAASSLDAAASARLIAAR